MVPLSMNLYESVKKTFPQLVIKMISMYARGVPQRVISSVIEDIQVFWVYQRPVISHIVDGVLPELEKWQTYLINNCYPLVFIDCMYATIKVGCSSKSDLRKKNFHMSSNFMIMTVRFIKLCTPPTLWKVSVPDCKSNQKKHSLMRMLFCNFFMCKKLGTMRISDLTRRG